MEVQSRNTGIYRWETPVGATNRAQPLVESFARCSRSQVSVCSCYSRPPSDSWNVSSSPPPPTTTTPTPTPPTPPPTPLLKWTASFLKTRSQSMLVEGKYSKPAKVLSGVPQGTVLGPLLFLIHINDLPSVVTSQVRLFVDDCLVYRPVHSLADQLALQAVLLALERWGNAWRQQLDDISVL